jgi:hypothetical protein
MEPGRWNLHGNWLERNQEEITVKGQTLIAWGQENWFTMVTKLVFPDSDRQAISLLYKGHLNLETRQYTFVLQHGILGRVEGEGWLAPQTIVQRYWVLGNEGSELMPKSALRQRCTGFETLYRSDQNTYYLSSSIMAGHYLISTMEATVYRQF